MKTQLNKMDKLLPKDRTLAIRLEEAFGTYKAQEWVDGMIDIVEAHDKYQKSSDDPLLFMNNNRSSDSA